METNNIINIKVIYVIVNQGIGSKVLHQAKTYGALGGAIIFAKGTVNNALLNFFSFYEEEKEIVLLAAENHLTDRILEELDKMFSFHKKNHGIAFTIKSDIIGFQINDYNDLDTEKGEEQMYKLITTIVSAEKAEDVIETARLAGAKGGTIINARGTLTNECFKVFGIEIEPRKEVVWIVAKKEEAESIVALISEKMDIDKPGNGIIITQDVDKVYGMHDDKTQ